MGAVDPAALSDLATAASALLASTPGAEGASANQIGTAAIAWRALVNCVGLAVLARRAQPSAWAARADARGGWRRLACRALPFCLLCAAVVTEKVVGLVFYLDLPVVVALFCAYLLQTRRLGVRNSVYLGVVTFLCADFCVALTNSVYLHAPAFPSPLVRLAVEFGYAALMVGLCALLRRWAPTDASAHPPARGFVALLLALLPYVVLRSSPVFYAAQGREGLTMEVLLVLCIAATFGAVAGNYSALVGEAERMRRIRLETELRERERHFQAHRATVEEVNRRYHDLVRYARVCDQAQGMDAAALFQTGNETLDVILWEAGEQCRLHDLRFVPSMGMDVRLLGFVDPFDLHAIVGNALENAVEAASLLPEGDAERREVSLRVTQAGQMAFIRVANRFAQAPCVEGGRLVTRKADAELHGFGVENIRRAAQRYGGSAYHEVRGDEFVLTAMLPLPEQGGPALG